MADPLDTVIERAVAEAAGRLAPDENGKFLEAWIEAAVVASVNAQLGAGAATHVKDNKVVLPDWDPPPGSFDARLFHADGTVRAAIECKQQKVDETLWDVFKLVAAAQLPGCEGGYAVVAATTKRWESSGDCVALFAPPVGRERQFESASLFEDWHRAWSDLLRGGTARPTRVPERIAVRLLARYPLAEDLSWELRAIRVEAVPGSGWLELGVDGWPVGTAATVRTPREPGALPAPSRLGRRFEEAVAYSAHIHGAQLRKGTEIPYLAHLLAVSALVLEHGGSEDEAIAALLHDAAEDQGGLERLADIRGRFGDAVAEIVAACADTMEIPKPDWRPRKERYVRKLGSAPDSVLRVSLADKMHNARAMLRDYEAEGGDLFRRFNAGKDDQDWYYGALADAFQERLPGDWLAAEFAIVVDRLRSAWGGAERMRTQAPGDVT